MDYDIIVHERLEWRTDRMNETYHVLIVEDDKQILDGIEIYLKGQGYIVHKAADGIEGLKQIYSQMLKD